MIYVKFTGHKTDLWTRAIKNHAIVFKCILWLFETRILHASTIIQIEEKIVSMFLLDPDTIPNVHNPEWLKAKWTLSRLGTIPNGHHPEWTPSRMGTIPNGHHPEWAPSRMCTIPNGHHPEYAPSRMGTIPNGHHLEWTPSRMDTIPNWHHPELTPSRMDTIPNGHHPEWTHFRMDGHHPRMGTIPEWTPSPNGHHPRMAPSPNGTIPEWHHPRMAPSRMSTYNYIVTLVFYSYCLVRSFLQKRGLNKNYFSDWI